MDFNPDFKKIFISIILSIIIVFLYLYIPTTRCEVINLPPDETCETPLSEVFKAMFTNSYGIILVIITLFIIYSIISLFQIPPELEPKLKTRTRISRPKKITRKIPPKSISRRYKQVPVIKYFKLIFSLLIMFFYLFFSQYRCDTNKNSNYDYFCNTYILDIYNTLYHNFLGIILIFALALIIYSFTKQFFKKEKIKRKSKPKFHEHETYRETPKHIQTIELKPNNKFITTLKGSFTRKNNKHKTSKHKSTKHKKTRKKKKKRK